MDFLNRSFAQVRDLFQSMTPGARLTAGLLLVVVVVSLGYLFTYQVSGGDVYLMGGESFSPAELQAMEAAFGKAKLGSYTLEGTKIRIPRGQQAQYLAALVDGNALPAQFGKAIDDALQTSNPFDSKQQREERIKAAKQKELSLIIRSMKDIEYAAVLFDTQTEKSFRGSAVKTASVSAKAVGSLQLDQEQVRKIRYTVAAAFAGMKPENVTVTDFNGAVYAGSDGGGSDPDGDAYIARKLHHEKDWQRKILTALCYVPGVTVTTLVELDKKQSLHTEEVKHDPKPIPVKVDERERTTSREGGGGSGGRPGYAAQQPKANAGTSLPTSVASSGGGGREEESDSQTNTLNTVGGTRTTTDDVGLTPKRVTATIGIPTSYFAKVWQERNPAGAGEEPKTPEKTDLDKIRQEEITKIRQYVAPLLLPVEAGSNQTDLVTVMEFQDIAPAEIPAPGFGENAITWLGQYWATLGLLGLAGFSLLMLRSMTRSTTAAPRPSPVPKSNVVAAESEEPEEEAATSRAPRLSRFSGSGPSLRDELSGLVAEDPDSAANILRAWIGSPGKP